MLHFTKQLELQKLITANIEYTERMTQPTAQGVQLIAEFLGVKTFAEYCNFADSIVIAIDARDGTRPGINQKAAKAFFGA